MTRRITNKDLEQLCRVLNNLTYSPQETWNKDENNQYYANIGNWHLDFAYGGVCLERISNKRGGTSDVLYTGHISKSELYNRISAFIAGIEFAQQQQRES